RFLRVKLRLEPVAKGKRFYLDVLDVSEGGLRALAPFQNEALIPGAVFEAHLLWRGDSLRCRCELVRVHPREIPTEDRWEYGLRFTDAPRDARATLRRLLKRLEMQAGG